MLERLRAKFEPVLRSIAKYLSVNPNLLTLLSVILAIPPPVIMYLHVSRLSIATAIALFITSSLMDIIDGAVARIHGRVSKRGAFLDSTCDRYVDALMMITAFILCNDTMTRLLIIICLVGSYMTSYARARAESLGAELRGIGLIERGERVILLIIFFIICYFLYGTNIFNIFTRVYIGILALLTNITAIQRIVKVCRTLR
ncbi:MAG: CDP-alcohol phosphatidyltransferase family protein [Crenarchaeota archaeon]|nr:CDP-alcohol phosphatidyltransferase family protein [Thermoproteota archaeon]